MPVSQDHRRVREDRSPLTPAATTHHPQSPPAPAPQWPMVGWYQPSQLIRTGIAYVGDVGDGWHSTYAIASSLARLQLCITQDIHGRTCDVQTERGNLLIFGGDEVYPTASRKAYEQRPGAGLSGDCAWRIRRRLVHHGAVLAGLVKRVRAPLE